MGILKSEMPASVGHFAFSLMTPCGSLPDVSYPPFAPVQNAECFSHG
jgi:hypothetical protein